MASNGQSDDLVRQAATVIRRLENRLGALEAAQTEPIAIVGIGCRMPGGGVDADSFWSALDAGVDAVDRVPADRWAVDDDDDGDVDPIRRSRRWGAFLKDVRGFDCAFFGISPREAQKLDPQQRLLLEITWEAFEHAGIVPDTLSRSRTGVFVGISTNDYAELGARLAPEQLDVYAVTGNGHCFPPGRLAYTFGLLGPALAVDTACSSSLVAVHLACQSLRNGESTMAVAGGVNLMLSPSMTTMTSYTQALSPDGRCRSFDASANGFVRGEGCGVVVLERLSSAVQAGRRVLALVRGSAVNQDGRSSGLTAPSVRSQRALIEQALTSAGLAAGDIGYVECHGTGTPLGDPIEVEALAAVLGRARGAEPCVLGAVKSNVGHLEAAAGMAGLIKAVMSLRHESIPGNLHFRTPNPRIHLDEAGFIVPTRRVPWPASAKKRRAGVSSFGMSGTNAHVVLEEAPAAALPVASPSAPPRAAELMVLSGKSVAALDAAAAKLAAHVAAHPEQVLADVAFSLATTRTHHEHRLALAVGSREELMQGLEVASRGETPAGGARGEVKLERGKLAFLFTGQGAQTVGMGRGLYDAWPVFRESLDRCAALFALERPLLEVMWSQAQLLDDTAYTQPALFALEVALCALWRSWGVVPEVVAGHSIGEIAAAHVAGVFSLEDACRLVAARGRLMQALPRGGAMVAIAAPEADVAAALSLQAAHAAQVSIAAVNGPSSVVISGDATEVSALASSFASRGVRTKALVVSHPFHSPLMAPMLAEFAVVASSISYQRPSIPLISNVSGALAGVEVTTPAYWVEHVRAAVRFADGVRALAVFGARTFIEVGPKATLSGLVPEILPELELTLLPTLRAGRPEPQSALLALGAFHASGGTPEWKQLFSLGSRHVELPSYAWQRQQYWLEPGAPEIRLGEPTGHPLLGTRIPAAGVDAVYEQVIDLAREPWLADHRVAGRVMFPGAGVAEILRAAAAHHLDAPAQVESLALLAPLLLPETGGCRLQVVLSSSEGALRASLHSQPSSAASSAAWTLHATATLLLMGETPPRLDIAALRRSAPTSVDVEEVYARFADMGLSYGPSFRGLMKLWRGAAEAVGDVSLPSLEVGAYGIHPALLDASLHAAAVLLGDVGGGPFLPFAMGGFRVHRAASSSALVHVRMSPSSPPSAVLAVDVTLLDEGGELVAELTGLKARQMEVGALQRLEVAASSDASYRLEWRAVGAAAASSAPSGLVIVAESGSAAALALGARLGAPVVEMGATIPPAAHVLCLWEPSDAIAAATSGLLMVQSLLSLKDPPRLWWVTMHAVALTAGERVGPDDAAIWGLGRVVMQEHPELRCTLIDVDDVEVIARELSFGDDEDQVAWRGGQRHVARLVRAAVSQVPSSEDYQLVCARKGTLDSLKLEAASRRPPAAGEVEIEVRASGLNFRDVLNALGMYPGEAGPLGSECAGEIVAVGAGVDAFRVGDQVMAVAAGAFRRFVTTSAVLVAPVPSGLSLPEAATIPVAFLTAWYALHDLAGLRRGERILVHAAAGGVGMAAVQIARSLGAEVLGTASPSKWDAVRALGVSHVASSRNLDFVEAFRSATGGVDVVLNALAGEFVDASLSLLSVGGRFLEMGKTDIRDAAALGPPGRYRAFDLFEASVERIGEMLRSIAAGFAKGSLRALPVQSFAVAEAESAFRFMAQARHVGKVALVAPRSRAVRRGGTVLVTGGLGALGLHVAHWLAAQGVEHLVLVGRRGLATPGAPAAVASLRALGALVTVASIDVAERAALAGVLAAIPADLPLRGVVHAAGALDDGVLAEQTPARVAAVMAPKVAGALHLHELTRNADLDLFVMFSSAAGTLGSAGQGPYAAANAFLDALAARRRCDGLPGQSLAWGPWADSGMAAELNAVQQARVAKRGVGTLSTEQGLSLLAESLQRAEAHLVLVPLDVRQLGRMFTETVPPLWRALVRAPSRASSSGPRGGWARELAALPAERRADAVLEVVRAEVARVLSLSSASAVPAERPLQELGLDSLMAVELRNALGRRADMTLPVTLAFDHPTPSAIARYVLDQVLKPAQLAHAPVVRLTASEEPIAVIGMGCRFPGGVDTPESFWRLLDDGVDAVTEVPRERWDIDAWYDANPDAPGKMTTRWGGFVPGIEDFEPSFFGMSPREAPSIDPQERMMLETAWEALERAGLKPEQLLGSDTGVYMGLCGAEYQVRAVADATAIDAYSLLGTAHSAMVGRISYWLGLKGPNMPIDTACSSSLVAVHLACQALRTGECTMALAGGANVLLAPEATVYFSRLKAMSPRGRCHAFSADADGYVRGEGCGVVVLKRLSEALRDGNPVLAVLKGSAVNQDGRSNGMTAPNGPSQQAVIRRALAQGGVAPHEIDYVECHGTGTPLGDPIEVQALGAVLCEGRTVDRPVVVGSVKTNIGHTEGASGVAGLIKSVLALQAQRIPRSLHFTSGNPNIAWDELLVKVAAEALPWPHYGRPRRAGVSSFGFSGTNAHVVLEEAPTVAASPASPQRSAELVVLSAKSPAALDAAAAKLRTHVAAHPEQSLADAAYSLATTRTHHEHRLALTVASRDELLAALAQQPMAGVRGRALGGKVVFVFPGQGSQWVGMGRELFASEPVFRTAIEACDRAIAAETSWSLIAELTGESSLIPRIDVVQPVLFAVEVALAALWRSWGVEPDCVVGHSMGEVAAAHVAGALSLADACAVICRRSVLLRRISGQGEMAVVELSVAEAEAAIVGHESSLSVAVSNSPRSTVLSGSSEALSGVLSTLEARGVFCRRVKVDVASHSPQVDVLRAELLSALAGLAPVAPQVAMRSTVTGAAVAGPQLAASYWADNLRQPVRFAEVIEGLLRDSHTLFVEMSPHPLLVPSIDEMRQGRGVAVGSLRREQPERRSLLEALGALHAHGHPLEWQQLFPSGGQRVPLPTSAWQRERYWLEPPAVGTGRSHGGGHPLLGLGLTLSTQAGTRVWETSVDVKRLRWLADHQVQGATLFPGAAYLEMALAAGSELLPGALELVELTLAQALIVPPDGAAQVQVVSREQSPGRLAVRIASVQGDGFIEHAQATVRIAAEATSAQLDIPALRQLLGDPVADRGAVAPALLELWRGPREALGRLALSDVDGVAYRVSPPVLDACLRVATAASGAAASRMIGVGVLRLLKRVPPGVLWCHARETARSGTRCTSDLIVTDASGAAVLHIADLVVEEIVAPTRRDEDDWFLAVAWESRLVPAARSNAARWVVLGGDAALRAGVGAALTSAGHRVHMAGADDDVSADAARKLFGGLGALPPTGILHLRSTEGGPDGIDAAFARGCESVLHVAQAISTMGWRDVPRLWLVTRGAQAVDGDAACWQAPVLGLGRVLALEHPELRCARVDLDPMGGDDVADLVAELVADDSEDEVAFRFGARRVARFARLVPEDVPAERSAPASSGPFRLEGDVPGSFTLRPHEPRAPGRGEVQIAVAACGPGWQDAPGSGLAACAGVVVARGDGVEQLALGQEVVALAGGTLVSHITVDARLVAPRPASLSAAQAAALLVAYASTWCALNERARLIAGERVLVHPAGGAIGQAAIAIARQLDAQVVAMAGSAEERARLIERGVGHAWDPQAADLHECVLADTGGQGVDVVLRAGSAEGWQASIESMAPDGRIIDLSHERRPDLQGNLSYGAVDLAELAERRPERVAVALHEGLGLLERVFAAAGSASPASVPVETFPISRASEAHRALSRGERSIAVTFGDPDARVRIAALPAAIRNDASYLVTGGLGGVGLLLAGWLVDRGAGHVVLMSREGVKTVEQEAALVALRARARVTVTRGDATDGTQLQRVLAEIAASGAALRGVVHAASSLDREFLARQSAPRLRTASAARMRGAWLLHELTLGCELDLFLLAGSAAGLLGAPGSAAAAAASTFLDALAWHRRARGLPAASIAWSGFSASGGVGSLSAEQGLAALDRIVAGGATQIGVVPIDVRQWVELYPAASSSHLLSRLIAERRVDRRLAADEDLIARLAQASPAERQPILAGFLRALVSQVLRIPLEKLDAAAPLTGLGMDSLMGLELRNRVEAGLGIRAPATLLWTYPTIDALAVHLAGSEQAPVAAPAPANDAETLETLRAMPEGEKQALLDDRLAMLARLVDEVPE